MSKLHVIFKHHEFLCRSMKCCKDEDDDVRGMGFVKTARDLLLSSEKITNAVRITAEEKNVPISAKNSL